MCRMKFYFTIKCLKWFILYRSDQYSGPDEINSIMDLIKKRAKQLFEMDMVLFGEKNDLPILIPDAITASEKALAKKVTVPGKKKS